jgi:hypothetical protein
LNVYFFIYTPAAGDPLITASARLFFAVSAFRCLFPVRYEHHVVFHDSAISSIFLTRLLATGAEVAYVFLFSHVLRVLDTHDVPFVTALSSLMVAQVVVSQFLAWAAILSGRLALYFYEELGWAVIFAANAAASAYLYFEAGSRGPAVLLQLSLVFAMFYLPWQVLHLRMLRADAGHSSVDRTLVGLRAAIGVRNRRTDAKAWGGLLGLSWMFGYWATIMPAWIFTIVVTFAQER